MTQIKGMQGDCELHQVVRGKNEEADFLAKRTVARKQHLTQPISFEVLHNLVSEEEESLPIEIANTWMTLIYKFLTEDEIPADSLAAKQVIRKFSRYALINGWLYRQFSTQPWLSCVTKDDDKSIFKDIHEGDCGSYEGARKIVQKAFR